MAKRPALGRGLAALLGEAIDSAVAGEKVATGVEDFAADQGLTLSGPEFQDRGMVDLPVNMIRRNPRQPRRVIDAEALEELATSIRSVGVVQPVIVREIEGAYELIAGERRWRAAQKAGFTLVPAIVRQASDVESLELALVENVVRQQLNPVDEAFALKVLLEDLGVTQESLAARVGRSRSAIANKIRLLDLPAAVQEALSSGVIAEGHGRALLGLSEQKQQLELARRVVEKGLSVREVEDEVRRLTSKATSRPTHERPGLDAELLDHLREAFFSAVGVVPRVKTRGGGGVIELPFKDRQDLDRMLSRLGS